VENANNRLWNNQEYFNKIPETYAKAISNYAENSITASKITNDLAFANINAYKNIIEATKENSRQLSEIGKRNIKLCEEMINRTQERNVSLLNNTS
jgi:hypothetical protein